MDPISTAGIPRKNQVPQMWRMEGLLENLDHVQNEDLRLAFQYQLISIVKGGFQEDATVFNSPEYLRCQYVIDYILNRCKEDTF